jgi:RNA polymerase primary sigma factor
MSQQHQDDPSLNKYFDLIRDLPMLTPEEEKVNGRLWQRDKNPEGLRMLVEGNLRFVVKVALKFKGRGLDLIDLISEGNLGLIEAAKRFDPERGNKFLTYAVWWVRQAMFNGLTQHGNRMRLPAKVVGQITQLNRIGRQLERDLGRAPAIEDFVKASNFTEDEVKRLKIYQQTVTPVSTEQRFADSDFSLLDQIEQNIEPSAMYALDQECFLDQVRLSLRVLKEKEQQVLALHFGLDGNDPITLERIGRSFRPPISRERVRQIEEKAFTKIRDGSKHLLEQFLQTFVPTGT